MFVVFRSRGAIGRVQPAIQGLAMSHSLRRAPAVDDNPYIPLFPINMMLLFPPLNGA